jgi:hypothetical protein
VSDVAKLKAEADAKRSRLEHTLHAIEGRATVLRLVNDVIARNYPPSSSEITEALRRNPLLAAGLALLVGVLAYEVNRGRKFQAIKKRHGRSVLAGRKIPTPSPETQETHHGR